MTAVFQATSASRTEQSKARLAVAMALLRESSQAARDYLRVVGRIDGQVVGARRALATTLRQSLAQVTAIDSGETTLSEEDRQFVRTRMWCDQQLPGGGRWAEAAKLLQASSQLLVAARNYLHGVSS